MEVTENEERYHQFIFGGAAPRLCFDCERVFWLSEEVLLGELCDCGSETAVDFHKCAGCFAFCESLQEMEEAAITYELEDDVVLDPGPWPSSLTECCD